MSRDQWEKIRKSPLASISVANPGLSSDGLKLLADFIRQSCRMKPQDRWSMNDAVKALFPIGAAFPSPPAQ